LGLRDRRLRTIAEIIHEADLADRKFTRAESAGIDLALHGVAAATQDDHELRGARHDDVRWPERGLETKDVSTMTGVYMEVRKVSRRGLCTTLFATVVGALMTRLAVAAELSLPMNLPEQQFTFDEQGN
jgi:hypothetical protein